MYKVGSYALATTLVVALAVILPSESAQAAKAKTVAPDGPYKVGAIVATANLNGRLAPAMIWYPARPAVGAKPHLYHGQLEGSAVLNAPPIKDGAPYPLIIFSHGMGGCANSTIFYVENLVSHGYVVVGADHSDSAMGHSVGEPDFGPGKVVSGYFKGGGDLTTTVYALFEDQFENNEFDFAYRPLEASALIDQALAWNADPSSPFHQMMDPDRIGMTGHSLGGFTTLIVGGVPFHCQDQPPPADQCDLSAGLDLNMDPCCMDYVRELPSPFHFRDERVKAIIATGPAIIFPELERAASELEVPVMIITGSHKKMEVPWGHVWKFYEAAPAPKYVIRVKASDHMTISDKTLTMGPIIRPFLPGYRSNFADKAEVYKDYSVAFFDLYVKGDDGKAATLSAPVNDFAELWSEAE